MEPLVIPTFNLDALNTEQRPTALWTASLLYAIAREEAKGRRKRRLSEPALETWNRFRGRLKFADFIALLFEDAAVIHPIPFDSNTLPGLNTASPIPESAAEAWVNAFSAFSIESCDYIADQARFLGISNDFVLPELEPPLKAHHKVLELPGSGAQIAHRLVSALAELSLQENFTVLCNSWQEFTLAGLVAVDIGAPHSNFIHRADIETLSKPEHPLRRRSFDFVIGRAPGKGGLFRAEDQLHIWFPSARIILV